MTEAIIVEEKVKNHDKMMNINFADFFSQEYSIVLRYIRKIVLSKEIAEDITAEAFARCYAKYDQVSKHESPSKWVTRVSFNIAMDTLRRRKSHSKYLSFFKSEIDHKSYDRTPQSTHADVFDEIVDKLSSRQQEIYILKYVWEYTVDEISILLNISKTNIYTQITRCNNKLKSDTLSIKKLKGEV
jgi:RNA polymerase sigma factor (sigma-70 family)